MSEPGKFEYTDPGTGLKFVWPQDAYIDVFQEGQWYPVKSINVWDYQEEQPTIARTQAAFEAKCREWIESSERNESP